MKTKIDTSKSGNKSKNRFFTLQNGSGFFFQPKLKVGQPGDKYEVEADRVAEEMVKTSESENQPFFLPANSNKEPSGSGNFIREKPVAESITSLVQKQEEEEEELQPKQMENSIIQQQEEEEEPLQLQPVEEEEEEIMPKSETLVSEPENFVEEHIERTKGNGNPIEPETKSAMENNFGTDFSDVKIHTDSTAVQLNKELSSLAFTTGNDIYFNDGKYNPGSPNGNKLLAHELTHTLQQGAGNHTRLVQRSTADDSYNRIEEAASGIGTDEEGIFSAIRECSQRDALRPRIQGILNSELSGYELFKARLLLKYGPESNFPPGILLIWEATNGAGTNERLVFEAIRSSSNRHLLQNSTWVQRTLRNELSGHDYAKAQLLFKYGTESSFPAYITALWNATEGAGTNENLLFNTLIALSPTEITELSTIPAFVEVIRNELSGSELQRFNDLISGTPPAIRDDQATSAYGGVQTGAIATTAPGDVPGTHDFSPDDVNQGEVGDCYFLASLAATANTNPNLLQNRISLQPDGSYNVILQVRDGDQFREQVVNVTASFPQYSGGTGSETYARGGDVDAAGNTELWVRLFEKAFAKLRGSFEEIHGGFESDALETITGQRAEEIELDDVANEELVTRLEASFTSNQPATAATKRSSFFAGLEGAEAQFATNNEIIGSHAYTVMSVTNDDITLRNPHGQNIGNLAVRTLNWAQFRRYFYLVTTIRLAVP